MDLNYRNRRVLIVGGSMGIGKATAKLALAEGAQVMIASRSADNLATAADELETATGSRPITLVADITEDSGEATLVEAVGAEWAGVLDVLVTAVGGSVRAGFEDLTDADWIANYTFNVLSTVRAIRGLIPALKKGDHGAVITLGAAASKMPYARQIMSNVHKAGLLGLTKTLGAELAPDGIRVNCVAPGRTLTPLWTNRAAKMSAEQGRPEAEILQEFSTEIPLGRFGQPEEIAVMVIWLGSPAASYVTGQAINVDGGIARGLL